jgi:hypothetical protein
MKIAKKILFAFTIFLSLSVLGLFFISTFYGDKICEIIINQLNKNIEAKISVSSSSLSLLRHFPNATITFKNVKIQSNKQIIGVSDSCKSTNLSEVQELSLKFNLIKLLQKSYIIKGLIIKNGYINLYINKHGQNNYTFWKNNNEYTANIQVNINSIKLEDIKFRYMDDEENFNCAAKIRKLNISGPISLNSFDISTVCYFDELDFPIFEHPKILSNIYFKINCTLIKKIIQFRKSELEIYNSKLYFTGSISCNKPYNYSIVINSHQIYTSDILTFIPHNEINKLKISNEKISLQMSSFGSLKNQILKHFDISAIFHNLNFTYQKLKFTKINGNVNLKGNVKKYDIQIKTLNSKLFNSEFSVNGNVKMDNELLLDIKSNLKLNFSDLNKIEFFNKIEFLKGTGEIQVYSKGTVTKNKNLNIKILAHSSTGIIQNLSIKFPTANLEINDINSNFELLDNKLFIKSCTGNIFENALHFSGEVNHVMNLFLDSIWNANIEGKLKCNKLNISKFLAIHESESSNNNILNANINLQLDTLIFDKISANQVIGDLCQHNNSLSLSNLSGNAFDGKITNGNYSSESDSGNLIISTAFKTLNVDISKLFDAFDNFGQNELTGKNIHGRLNASVMGDFYINKQKNIDKNKTSAKIDLKIVNGSLTNFKPISKLSKFIEIDEVNQIKFKEIKNTVIISKNMIIIPTTEISSSALDLTLSGIHSFENDYEYHFKVLLSDILFKKARNNKKENLEFGQIEKDTVGKPNLYIMLKGKGNNYKFTYDNKQAIKSFGGKLQSEKKQLKEIFKEEFGLFKKDTSAAFDKTKNKKKFTVDFDDSNNKQKIKSDKPKTKNQIEWKDE